MRKRGVCRRAVYVRLGVCYVRVLCRNETYSHTFLTIGIHIILVFPHQILWQYSNGGPPLTGVSNAWRKKKLNISLYLGNDTR